MPRVGIVLIDTPGVTEGSNGLALEITPGVGKSVFSKVIRMIISERKDRKMVFRQSPARFGGERKGE